MRMHARHAVAVAVLAASAAGSSFAGAVADNTKDVEVVGGNRVNIQNGFRNTFRFGPGRSLTVSRGQMVTWENGVDPSGEGEPHSITIADEDKLPTDLESVFECGGPGTACEPALGHVDGDFNPIPGNEVINAGPAGLDRVGDSLLLGANTGDTISAVISAPSGTTLSYVCAVHPWMQGRVRVR